MSELFLKVVNMSISASWLVLAVLILRLVLKKSPKWVNILLWGIVAVRLLCPFSVESPWSMMPSAETFPEKVITGPSFAVQTGIAPVDNRINDYLDDRYFEGVTVPANNGYNVMTVLTVVWIIGVLLLAAYTVISYWRLRRKVDTAVLLRDNIFQSESVISPFVLGIITPKIYLPFKLDAQSLEYVVAHEMAHIRRKDHWWKPLGFLLLTIHWFNPLMWIAYVLLCRDIELACDEKVIRELDSESRADYTQALVECSVDRRMIAACPLAFGEVGVKERVRSVMNYKKPGFWAAALAVAACAVLAVCFLTDPVNAESGVGPDALAEATADASGSDKTDFGDREEIARMEADRAKLGAELEALKAEEEALRAEIEALRSKKSELAAAEDPQDPDAWIPALLDIISQENHEEYLVLCAHAEETLRYCYARILSGAGLGEHSAVLATACHMIAMQWDDELLMLAAGDAEDPLWAVEFAGKAEALYAKYGASKFQQMYPAAWIYIQMKNEEWK